MGAQWDMALTNALIVEDLEMARIWLAEVLQRALDSVRQVDTAATLAQARNLIALRHYDLAVVDWSLPDGSAESLIQNLTQGPTPTLVVVATIHDDDAHVFPALQAGASGYVLKTQPLAVVQSQLQRIALGEPALSPSIARRILGHFHALAGAGVVAQPEAEPTPLTKREEDVLRLLAKGYKAAEIADKLDLSVHTVNGYVRDIYAKLGVRNKAEATLEAARRGLVR